MEENDSVPPTTPERTGGVIQLLFGSSLVTRSEYFVAGLLLMLLKYGVEFLVFGWLSGHFYLPHHFLSPLENGRASFLNDGPLSVFVAYLLWTIPFLWIALSMSIRRCVDAGISPWIGLLTFVPLVQYPLFLVLCFLPTNPRDYRTDSGTPVASSHHSPLTWDIVTLAFGTAYCWINLLLSIYLFDTYGNVVFFTTPVVIGIVSSYLNLMGHPGNFPRSVVMAIVSSMLAGCSLLLLAAEGVICLAMAVPIVVPLAVVGAILGSVIWEFTKGRGQHWQGMSVVFLLPFAAIIESQMGPPPEQQVQTQIVIDAPPEVVWQEVIGFSEITERPAWYFRLGIACPTSATIVGEGVGAVRYCRFTTGDFVEPITKWDAPHTLAFDVVRQPHPMIEMNPFGDPHPPHLDSALQSRRGEFRLEELPGNRTRLIGTTWYVLHMRPRPYWSLWTTGIIHRIHARVLRHVKQCVEEKVSHNLAETASGP